MIISKTPYRISFFGGGTDYPDWYNKNNGEVISSTIDRYLYISCRFLPTFFDHKYRIVYSIIEDKKKIKDIQHPVVREALKLYYKKNLGLEIHYDGDLPSRSGMGSSSVFVVGFLNLINSLNKRKKTKMGLALQSIHLEQEVMKEVVGSQDQIAATYGGLNSIQFQKNSTFKVKKIFKSKEDLNLFSRNFYLVYTGKLRTAETIASTYVKKLKSENYELLEEITRQTQYAKNLLKNKNFDDFGRLLHETWQIKRKLSDKVSNKHIDEIYDAGLGNGALGGKLLGAGGGGFILFYVKKID